MDADRANQNVQLSYWNYRYDSFPLLLRDQRWMNHIGMFVSVSQIPPRVQELLVSLIEVPEGSHSSRLQGAFTFAVQAAVRTSVGLYKLPKEIFICA